MTTDKNRTMSPEQLRLLIEAMEQPVLGDRPDSGRTLNMLESETIKFRDQLKESTGVILTVGDAREALAALESYLHNEKMPAGLTDEQKALAQIWIDRLTLFETN